MTKEILSDSPIVSRDAIREINFPNEEVISDEENKKQRSRKIHRATSLGNLEQQKVHIIFNDDNGLKRVHTTIWAQTESKIILKGNVQLPVHRIVDIQI